MRFAGRIHLLAVGPEAQLAKITDEELVRLMKARGLRPGRMPRPHKIGRCALEKADNRTWIVRWDGKWMAHSCSARSALSFARHTLGKVRKRRLRQGLVGVRCWRVIMRPDGPYLQSWNYEFVWEGPHVVADQKPQIGTVNGIHCFKPGHEQGHTDPQLVAGTVEIFGRIVQGERGYRAEHAIVRTLQIDEHYAWPPLIAALEQRYQCSVEVSDAHR